MKETQGNSGSKEGIEKGEYCLLIRKKKKTKTMWLSKEQEELNPVLSWTRQCSHPSTCATGSPGSHWGNCSPTSAATTTGTTSSTHQRTGICTCPWRWRFEHTIGVWGMCQADHLRVFVSDEGYDNRGTFALC